MEAEELASKILKVELYNKINQLNQINKIVMLPDQFKLTNVTFIH